MLRLQIFVLLGKSSKLKKSSLLRNLFLLPPSSHMISKSYDFVRETFLTTDHHTENNALHARLLLAVSSKRAIFH